MLQVPKLTIIMPVYNTAQYLPRAFEALLKQVDKSFKLIVVDDGSTDNSAEVAQSYAKRFPYFKLIKKKNGGPSDARNVGMKYIDTPYVTFQADDLSRDAEQTSPVVQKQSSEKIDVDAVKEADNVSNQRQDLPRRY